MLIRQEAHRDKPAILMKRRNVTDTRNLCVGMLRLFLFPDTTKEKAMPLRELRQKKEELQKEMVSWNTEHRGKALSEEDKAKWKGFIDQRQTIEDEIEREAILAEGERREAAQEVKIGQATDAEKEERDRKAKQSENRWEDFGEFMSAVHQHAATEGRTLDPRLELRAATGAAEKVPSDGGFLVQNDFASELLKRTYEVGQIVARTNPLSISKGNGTKINSIDETSRVNGSRWGGIQAFWADEADAMTGSKPKFKQLEFTLKKLTALVYATDELLEDQSVLQKVISEGFAEEMSFKIEDGIINGTGAGQLLGILTGGSLISVAKETGQLANTVQIENLTNMWSRCWARSRRNAVWLINQDIEPQLLTMGITFGTGGAPVYMPAGGISQAPFATILGRPVIPVEYMATLGTVGDIVLADLSQYILAKKGGLQTASSIHVRFLNNEQVFRFVMRLDGQPIWNTALTPFKGTNTLSPFVALAERA